ncbi:complement factor H-like [Parambassis ranga]|uniref:Complement factor H-like n=1 Tax=Parambassis ranga TaxID=210632 RepID=A0A6P7HTK3_9TELE|nr:complement factor H-like [Parambassis ranga]
MMRLFHPLWFFILWLKVNWSAQQNVVTCGRPQILHGSVSGDTQVYNKDQYLTFECNDGYKAVEDRPSKCSKVGNRAEWIPTPMCEVIKCRVTLKQGTQYDPRYKNVFLPGETLRVTCEEREWISNRQTTSAETTCQDGGQWTIDPVCREVTCSRPPDRSLQRWDANRGQQIKLGDSVWYTCKPGYKKPSYNTWATCTRDEWTPNPLCKEITCPRKVYPHAEIVGDIQSEYQYNQRVEYACNNGFEGTFTITCRDNGWSPESQQCRGITCNRLDIENATISSHKSMYQHNEEVTYRCMDGKTLTLTCQNGAWIGPKACSAKTCEEPELFYGYYHHNLNDSELIYGVIIKYVCEDGYKLVGEGDTNECLLYGWDKPHPTCQQITCELRASDPNLRVNPRPDDNEPFTVGRKLRFSCIDDLGLTGPSEIECLSTGLWSDDVPTCSEKCQVTKPPQNVNVNPPEGSRLVKGEQLTFSCRQRGQAIKGKTTVECLENAQWSDDFPTCGDPSYCGKPPPLLDGDTATIVSKLQYNHNEKVQYSCQRFYKMQGQPYMTCLNGEWIGEMKCLQPCIVDRAAMNERNIGFRYKYDDKLYALHGDHLNFLCTRGTPDRQIPMRQMCNDGVITLPRCV